MPIRFILTFCTILLVLFGIELTAPAQRWFVVPFTEGVGTVSGIAAAWFDGSIVTRGATISDPASGFGITVVSGCNGVEAMIILLAAVLAYPATWRHRAIGLLAGFAAIQGLNVVRVVSLFYLGRWNLSAFEFAHLYVWQVLIMLDVLVVWIVWLRALKVQDAAGPQTAGLGAS